MYIYIKTYLAFGIFFTCCSVVLAEQIKPITQQIYEEIFRTACQKPSYAEAHQLKGDLKCSNFSPLNRVGLDTKLEDLDQIIEASVFDILANNQNSNLRCAYTKISDYLENTELRVQLSDVACEKFELVKELLKELDSVKDWIKSYKTVNDSSIRVVPKEDQNKYKKILIGLEKRQQVLQSMISNIRQTTLLFESQEVFEFALKQLSSKQNAKKSCATFKEKLPTLLRETSTKIENSLKSLDNYRMTSDLKEQLWQHARSDEIISNLTENGITKMGTICRMEARYGKGAEMRDKLIQIGFLAVPPILKITESLAVASYAARTRTPFYISKAVLTAEVALGISLNIHSLKKDCLDKNPTVLANGTKVCNSKNVDERKSLILATQNQNSCILSATLGAASTYFSIGAVDKILKGIIPDSLMTKIGESNSKISNLISHKGFYDAVEVVATKNEGTGKVVTIALKANDTSLVRPSNFKLSIPDPVLNPQNLIDNLGAASKNLRLSATNGKFQLPDVALYRDRISKYNAVAAPNKKIAVTFYKTKDKIQASRSYNKRFIEEGGLPMAPSGTPGSTFTNTGHLHIHDVTAHGASVTIPQEIIDNARSSYRIVIEFEDYLKTNSPILYRSAKKGSEFGGNLFDRTNDEISRTIDFSTGLWTHFVTNMRKGDLKNASYSLWQRSDMFTGARSMGEAINEVSYAFKRNKKIEDAFNEFLKIKKVDLNKPIFPGTENMTRDEYVKFLYRKQQEMVFAIGSKNF